jgi:hypothetical protein
MQRLVDWLLDHRAAVIVIAVVFAPNIGIISSAVIGLQWAHRGPAVAIGDALLASLAITIVAIGAAGGLANSLPVAFDGCLAILIGCIVGGILRATGTLTLAVQILLLTAFVGIALFTLFGTTSNELFDAQMAQIVEILRLQQRPEEEIEAVVALQPRLVGLYGFEICLVVLFALLLTRWALGYARHDPDFGREFRALRIGYVLGVPAALILALTLVLNVTLLHNLFGVAALAFMLQGLAALHSRGHAARWHPVQYLPVYVIGVLFGTYLLFVGVFGEGVFA